MTEAVPSDRFRDLVDRVCRRPLVTVGIVGAVVTVVQWWAIARLRPLGAFDADEAGYLANALRLQRDLGTPSGFVHQLERTATGPLAPMLSAVAATVGSRTVWWAMAVQPVLQVVTAIGTTGVVRRLADRGAAVVAGLVVLGLPVALLAGRSYQLAGAAAASAVLAVWALLASERGTRLRPMLAFGCCVGALCLARTMTIAFLPAIAVGVLVFVERERRVWRHVVLSAVVALVVALPWYVLAWGPITDYLVEYGYGETSGAYGPGSVLRRGVGRVGVSTVDVRALLLVPALVVVVAVVRRLRGSGRLRRHELSAAERPFVAVGAIVVVGYLVLLTSSNAGFWFELPLEVLALAVVVAATRLLPSLLRRRLAIAVLVVAAVNLLLIGRIGDPGPDGSAVAAALASPGLFGDVYHADTLMVEAEPRVASPGRLRDEAAAEWWGAHTRLVRALDVDDLTDGRPDVRPTIYSAGSSPMINHNSLLLALELGHPVNADAVSLVRARDLPAAPPETSVLVVFETRARVFPGVADGRAVRRVAIDAGWREDSTVGLPDGGEAVVLRPPTDS